MIDLLARTFLQKQQLSLYSLILKLFWKGKSKKKRWKDKERKLKRSEYEKSEMSKFEKNEKKDRDRKKWRLS